MHRMHGKTPYRPGRELLVSMARDTGTVGLARVVVQGRPQLEGAVAEAVVGAGHMGRPSCVRCRA